MWIVDLEEKATLYSPPSTLQCIIDTKISMPKQAIFINLSIDFRVVVC